jgi:hypothetical protein
MRAVPTLVVALVLSVCVVFTIKTSSSAALKSKPSILDEVSEALKVAASIDHGKFIQNTNPALSDDIIEEVRKKPSQPTK